MSVSKNISAFFLLIISTNSFAVIENVKYMTCMNSNDSFTVKFDKGNNKLTFIDLYYERTKIKEFSYTDDSKTIVKIDFPNETEYLSHYKTLNLVSGVYKNFKQNGENRQTISCDLELKKVSSEKFEELFGSAFNKIKSGNTEENEAGIADMEYLAKIANENDVENVTMILAVANAKNKNRAEALKWFEKTIEYDKDITIPEARYYAGMAYRKGLGTKVIHWKASIYLLEAAEAGMEDAYYPTSVYFIKGNGNFKVNYEEALKWARKAKSEKAEKAISSAMKKVQIFCKEKWNPGTIVTTYVFDSESMQANINVQQDLNGKLESSTDQKKFKFIDKDNFIAKLNYNVYGPSEVQINIGSGKYEMYRDGELKKSQKCLVKSLVN